MKNIEHQIPLTKNLLESIVQQSPIGIVAVSREPLEIIYSNATARRLGHPPYLFSAGQLLNACLNSCRFFYPDGQSCPTEELPFMRAFIEDDISPWQQLLVQWTDSNQQWLHTAAAPIYDQGQTIAAVWMFSDISDIMFQQNKLHELNGIKKSLLRVLAHDLRSAFNGLLFLSDALSENIDQNGDIKSREYAGMIRLSAQRAFDMTSGILNWAIQSESSAELVYEQVVLYQLINTITDELRFQACSKKIKFHINVTRDLHVYCDRVMIGCVLRNLLSNAIKFSYSGNVVDLCAEENCKQVKVTVKDYGIGMNPENVKKFNTSRALHCKPGTEGEKGSGIGLLICKDFIARHHGELYVHSNPGAGCSFVFSIPVEQKN